MKSLEFEFISFTHKTNEGLIDYFYIHCFTTFLLKMSADVEVILDGTNGVKSS